MQPAIMGHSASHALLMLQVHTSLCTCYLRPEQAPADMRNAAFGAAAGGGQVNTEHGGVYYGEMFRGDYFASLKALLVCQVSIWQGI